MATQTVAFRASEEEKNYIYDLTGSLKVPLSKFFKDLCKDMMNGNITYDGNRFTGKTDSIPVSKEPAAQEEKVDLSELFTIAQNRRATAQSVLNNALKPYRASSFTRSV